LTKKIIINIISLIVIIIPISYFFYLKNKYDPIRKELFEGKNVIYKITEIEDLKYHTRTGPTFSFVFTYNDEVYDERFSLTGNPLRQLSGKELQKYIGKKFLVKFNKEHPIINELLIDKIITDSLIKCCKNKSWSKLPFQMK